MRNLAPATAACLLLAMMGSGCLGSGPGTDVPSGSRSVTASPLQSCSQGYFVGCDSNPDAQQMLAKFGLHQITNITDSIVGLRVENGMVVWMQDAYHAYLVASSKEVLLPYDKQVAPHAPHPFSCCVLYSQTPYSEDGVGDFNNGTAWLWNPLTGVRKGVSLPSLGAYSTARGGFDGNWAMLRNRSATGHDGLTAVHVESGRSTDLFSPGPFDSSYYGTPQVGATLSNGSAFLNFLSYSTSEVNSKIVEYDLDAGTETERLTLTNSSLTRLDSSPRYIVASGSDGDRFAWVMDRTNHTWWNVQRNPDGYAVNPVVGSDWVVYYEEVPAGEEWIGGLVGIHLPTGTRHELVPDNDDLAFVDWDTDGRYLVAEVELGWATGNAAYPGTQLYWKELPDIPSI